MRSDGLPLAEMIGLPGTFALWIFGRRYKVGVLGYLLIRFLPGKSSKFLLSQC